MKRTRNYTATKLKCEHCGAEMPIQRRSSLKKEDGHVKHMYCYVCKDVTAHIEQRSLDVV